MNGSASAPNSATMKGVLWVIRPLMKCTSRLKRSSFATMIGDFSFFAAFNAAASCGRRLSASAPFPVSTSLKV
jgi:hypothetical protein